MSNRGYFESLRENQAISDFFQRDCPSHHAAQTQLPGRQFVIYGFLAAVAAAGVVVADETERYPSRQRRQVSSADPHWDGYQNRQVPDVAILTRQNFGWSPSNRARGTSAGEIGGTIHRSITPASYAKVIADRTLHNRLRASGRFALTRVVGNSGVLFGFYNANSRGWRANNSLVLRLDGNANGCFVFFEYGTQNHRAHGGGAFQGERWQTTSTKPIRADGTSHVWEIEYDPEGADRNGLITLTLDGESFRLPLQAGHKQDGACFNRFGILNQQTSGQELEVWFDDLEIDGEPVDLSKDPQWEEKGNRIEFVDRVRRPLQDFGFSPRTNYAGGQAAGEIGGIFWRVEQPSYYADAIGKLDLEQQLQASGKLSFRNAGSDSGVWFGWFDAESRKASAAKANETGMQRNFLGLLIEGPSRVGHYFRPGYRTSAAQGRTKTEGPLLRPDGAVHLWTLRYDPRGANGQGQVTATLDGVTQTLDLDPGDRQHGAAFDRFGFFTASPGGHHVEIYLDDLEYSIGKDQ